MPANFDVIAFLPQFTFVVGNIFFWECRVLFWFRHKCSPPRVVSPCDVRTVHNLEVGWDVFFSSKSVRVSTVVFDFPAITNRVKLPGTAHASRPVSSWQMMGQSQWQEFQWWKFHSR